VLYEPRSGVSVAGRGVARSLWCVLTGGQLTITKNTMRMRAIRLQSHDTLRLRMVLENRVLGFRVGEHPNASCCRDECATAE
jgi:hypothetical protein